MTLNICSNTCSYITLSIKTKITSKLETGIYFLNFLMSLRKVLEMFLIFSVMEHVETKFNLAAFWKMRELPLYTVLSVNCDGKKFFFIQQNVFKL